MARFKRGATAMDACPFQGADRVRPGQTQFVIRCAHPQNLCKHDETRKHCCMTDRERPRTSITFSQHLRLHLQNVNYSVQLMGTHPSRATHNFALLRTFDVLRTGDSAEKRTKDREHFAKFLSRTCFQQ